MKRIYSNWEEKEYEGMEGLLQDRLGRTPQMRLVLMLFNKGILSFEEIGSILNESISDWGEMEEAP